MDRRVSLTLSIVAVTVATILFTITSRPLRDAFTESAKPISDAIPPACRTIAGHDHIQVCNVDGLVCVVYHGVGVWCRDAKATVEICAEHDPDVCTYLTPEQAEVVIDG